MSDSSSDKAHDDAEIEFIPEDEVVEEEGKKQKAEKKLSELELCKKERQEYLDGWQRAQADYANLKKRFEDDKKYIGEYAVESFIQELLPTLDAFDMAMSNKDTWEAVDQNWRTGIEFIYSSMLRSLEDRGVTPYDPTGEDFNAELHNSVEMIETDDESQDGKVVSVIQKGYKMKDRIIRVPNVKVGVLKQ